MPTYKFSPNVKSEEITDLFTFLETYNFDTKTTDISRIVMNQTFTTDKYLSSNYMKNEKVEFVSDEPYISPILCSFTGSGECKLEVPDCGHLFDIYVSTLKDPVKLFFNNNSEGDKVIVTKTSSGIIFQNMAPAGIRVVNGVCDSEYCISLLLTNHFAENNG